jgi:monovalent cation:H+ antiporter-2, CPA2 family
MTSAIQLASYKEALILLGTAGIVVPIVHRLRMSPILGFLAAGALLGPHLLGALSQRYPFLAYVTVQDGKDIAWLGELGVVFLLFVIGLELSPQRLMTMRRLVFGLGSLQMLISAAAIGFLASMLGVGPRAAALIGLSLALSSTAIVIELMAAQDRLSSSTGRSVFAVLLLQDLAVVPILFLVGAFGAQSDVPLALSLGQAMLQAIIVLAVIVGLGLWLLRPLFRLVAATASHELFMATTLFVVLGSGVLSAAAGLSMALGAFVGGLLLAETEYRRAIEATIEPFKGLLLGVFFFSVGMQIDIAVLKQSPGLILAMAAGLIVLKTVLFVPIARWFGVSWPSAIESGLLLGPGGEFAFIIIGLAASSAIIDPAMAGRMLAVVTLSMAALPLLAVAGRRLVEAWRARTPVAPELLVQPNPGDGRRAIVVGYGRVGTLVVGMLETHNVAHLATELDGRAVTEGRRNGHAIYFGDAKNLQFLERCGVREASAVIITISGPREIDAIVQAVRTISPTIPIVSRARDAFHAEHLYSLGVNDAVPETIEASLQLSEAALVSIGVPAGLVIASIHEKRDEFRALLLSAAQASGQTDSRAVRRKLRAKTRVKAPGPEKPRTG